jgi:hypothetical protein
MTKFFEVLSPEAQNDLIRDSVIKLVTVCVAAVPDPERPDGRLAMKISAEVDDDFRPGIPWIDEELDRIRALLRPGRDESQLRNENKGGG